MSLDWHMVREELSATTKQRLHALELLSVYCGKASLDLDQTLEFVDLVPGLLQDNNYKVAQQTLHILSTVIHKEKEGIKPYTSSIIPHVVERLADTRQQVRQDSCEVLLDLLAVLKPDYVLEKMARFWSHRHWKVRHGVIQTMAEAVGRKIPGLLTGKDQNSYLITQVVNLVEDPNDTVRDAAIDCLQEIYRAIGPALVDNLRRQCIRPASLTQLILRLDEVAPTHMTLPDAAPSPTAPRKTKEMAALLSSSSETDISTQLDTNPATNHAKKVAAGSTKRALPAAAEESDTPAPVPLGSERELVAEFDTAALVLDSLTADWKVRIAAMARVEGIVAGNPGMYDAIAEAFKLLKGPFAVQLEDRRSAVCKRACSSLTAIAGAMGLRFSEPMIHFLPVLFKVLPITVQIMAESSSECVRLLLERCQAPKAVLVLVQAATKDNNNKIKQMCARYLVQVMEQWDPTSYHRYLDDLETAMTVCAQAATAESRSAARDMFAAYARTLPDMAEAFLRRVEPSVQERLCKGGAPSGGSGKGASARPSIAPRKGFSARPRLPISRPSANVAPIEIQVFAPPPPRAMRAPPVQQQHQELPFPCEGEAHAACVISVSGVQGTLKKQQMQPPPPAVARDEEISHSSSNSRKSMSMGASARVLDMNGDVQASVEGKEPAALRMELSAPVYVPPGSHATSQPIAGLGPASRASSQHHPAPQHHTARRASTNSSGVGIPIQLAGSYAAPQRVMTTAAMPPLAAYSVSTPAPAARFHSSTDGAPSTATAAAPSHALGRPSRRSMPGSHALTDLSSSLDDIQHVPYTASRVATSSARSAGTWGNVDVFGSVPGTAGKMPPHPALFQQQQPRSIPKLVAALLSGSKQWSEKVELLNELTSVFQAHHQLLSSEGRSAHAAAPHATDIEKLAPRFVDLLEDAHHKVATASIECFCVGLSVYPTAFEACMERLLPVLFVRMADPKESVKSMSATALSHCAATFSADLLLAGLVRAMEACKMAKGRLAVLEFGATQLGQGRPAGVPCNHVQMRQWLSRVVPLMGDKNAEVKQKAGEAVQAMYCHINSNAVLLYADNAPAAEFMSLKRLIGGMQEQPAVTASAGGNGPSPQLGLPAFGVDPSTIVATAGGACSSSPVNLLPATVASLPAVNLHGSHAYDDDVSAGADAEMTDAPMAMSPAMALTVPNPNSAAARLDAAVAEHMGSTPPTAMQFEFPSIASHQPQQHLPFVSSNALVATSSSHAFRQHSVAAGRGVGASSYSIAAPPPSRLASVTDVPAVARQISLLTLRLQASPNEDTVSRLRESVRAGYPVDAWEPSVPALALATSSALCSAPSVAVREALAALLGELAEQHPAPFLKSCGGQGGCVLDVLVPSLLAGCMDHSKDVALAAKVSLDLLVECPPLLNKVVVILLSRMPQVTSGKGQSEDLYAVVRCLQHAITYMPASHVESLEGLMVSLQRAYADARPDVRKAVVFALVAIRMALGDDRFQPCLDSMCPTQQKLVAIYYNRAVAGQ